jgi:DNA replication protein DnaC
MEKKLSMEDSEKNKDIRLQQDGIRRQRIIEQSGIPFRFLDRRLSNFVAENDGQRIALNACQSYAENFEEIRETGRSMIFVGKPGTGKTHLAVGIALEVMDRG